MSLAIPVANVVWSWRWSPLSSVDGYDSCNPMTRFVTDADDGETSLSRLGTAPWMGPLGMDNAPHRYRCLHSMGMEARPSRRAWESIAADPSSSLPGLSFRTVGTLECFGDAARYCINGHGTPDTAAAVPLSQGCLDLKGHAPSRETDPVRNGRARACQGFHNWAIRTNNIPAIGGIVLQYGSSLCMVFLVREIPSASRSVHRNNRKCLIGLGKQLGLRCLPQYVG